MAPRSPRLPVSCPSSARRSRRRHLRRRLPLPRSRGDGVLRRVRALRDVARPRTSTTSPPRLRRLRRPDAEHTARARRQPGSGRRITGERSRPGAHDPCGPASDLRRIEFVVSRACGCPWTPMAPGGCAPGARPVGQIAVPRIGPVHSASSRSRGVFATPPPFPAHRAPSKPSCSRLNRNDIIGLPPCGLRYPGTGMEHSLRLPSWRTRTTAGWALRATRVPFQSSMRAAAPEESRAPRVDQPQALRSSTMRAGRRSSVSRRPRRGSGRWRGRGHPRRRGGLGGAGVRRDHHDALVAQVDRDQGGPVARRIGQGPRDRGPVGSFEVAGEDDSQVPVANRTRSSGPIAWTGAPARPPPTSLCLGPRPYRRTPPGSGAAQYHRRRAVVRVATVSRSRADPGIGQRRR